MKQLKIGFDLDGVILFWLFFLKKNAKKILLILIDDDHQIKIVTARSGFMLLLAKVTLKIYGLGDIKIVGVGKNGQKYKELDDFDIYIDNLILHLLAITKDNKDIHLFIFGKKSQGGFRNLKNWWQIYREVRWILTKPEKKLAI